MVSLPDPIRKSYARQFAATVLVVVGLVAVTGFVLQGIATAELQAQADTQVERTATAEAANLQAWIERTEHTTLLLSDYEALHGEDTDAIESLLYTRLNELPSEYDAIHYVDRDGGTVEATTDQSIDGDEFSSLGFVWPDTESGGVVPVGEQSGVVMSDVTAVDGTPKLAFAAPVGDSHAVVLVSNVEARALAFETAFEGSNVQVVNREGVVQIDRNAEAVGTTVPETDQRALERGLAGEAGVLVDDGRDQLVGYTPVEGTDWGLIVHTPQSEAYAVGSDIRMLLLGLIALSLGGFLLMGGIIGRTTVSELRTLSEKAEQLEAGEFDTTVDSDRIDEFGQLFDAFGNMRDTLVERIEDAEQAQQRATEQQREAEQAAERAEQLATEAEQRTERLEDRAATYSETMQACADGDLTRRLSADGDSGAMREIAEAFNEMMDDIEVAVADLQAFADEVAAASKEANTGAQEVRQAGDEVSTSVQEIAAGADEQREKLDEVSGEMSNLSAMIEEVTSTAQTVAEKSDHTAELAAHGESTVTRATEEIETVKETMRSTVENVERLDELAAEIDEIVDLIGDIAEQTNMLALNANIEAARAGGDVRTDGGGFAVVADEVKALAEETRTSAEDVAGLIEEVQGQTGTTVEEIRAAQRQVQETSEAVEEAGEAFVEMSEQVAETDDGVQEISGAMEEQADSAQEVVTMVDDVERISGSTADEAETVSAAAEEQASSMSQVSSNVESLAEQADRLQARLEAFTVEGTRR